MAFDPNKITYFAKTDARGKSVAFGIKAKDRQRHMYVIGKTGMGKSTLLENMAVQDIQNGEGMAFIDPHGSAAEVLLNYIPEHRVNDVLYFAPFDAENPVSFNIMEDVGPDKRHLVVSGLMSVFKKIWVDAWSARMEYILSNTLLALLEYPDSTLLGVNRMLSDKDYRKLVVENVKDPGVRAFWVDEFAKYNERYMQEAGDAIKNKIGQFTSNPIIRNIIGQSKSSFDIRKMMDEKKILIMNLSKGLIGESNANLLGSMLTTRIYLAAMSRADLPPEKMREMPNFYFYVDEFQSFANATFANILSEARKYHLNLTIAHQYITQMEEEVRDAVFGNVGTIVSFRVGPFDAEVLETIFTPQFLATDIVNLSFAQIYLTLMIDGIGSQPFSATTLTPIEPPQVSYKQMAISSSRAQFSRPRREVEERIHKFHEPIVIQKSHEKPLIPDAYARSDKGQKPRTPQSALGASPSTLQSAPHSPSGTNTHTQKPSHQPTPHPEGAISHREENSTKKHAGEHRRDDRERPKQKVELPRPIAPKKDVQASDLRSILRQIVAQDSPESKETSSTGRTEMHHMVEKVNVPTTLKVPPPQHTQAVSGIPQKEVVAPITELIPQKTVHAHDEKSHTKRRTPTPKELERMMRVTTSDKPPH